MTFYTNRGNDRLELEDGSAFLTAEGIEYPVCAADVTCSAFKMDETAFLGSQIDDIYYNKNTVRPTGPRGQQRKRGEHDLPGSVFVSLIFPVAFSAIFVCVYKRETRGEEKTSTRCGKTRRFARRLLALASRSARCFSVCVPCCGSLLEALDAFALHVTALASSE